MIGIDASDIQRLDSEKRNSILKKAAGCSQICDTSGYNQQAVYGRSQRKQ
ncbi:hypothetical protein [Petroclostridium xylanilyticum]|nr:hypothetical protein [Petroclostridium xylanilyticum]